VWTRAICLQVPIGPQEIEVAEEEINTLSATPSTSGGWNPCSKTTVTLQEATAALPNDVETAQSTASPIGKEFVYTVLADHIGILVEPPVIVIAIVSECLSLRAIFPPMLMI